MTQNNQLGQVNSKAPKKRRLGIRWKFFVYMMLFLLILLGLLWSFQVVFFEDIYKAVKVAEVKGAASILSECIELNDAEFSDVAENIASDHSVCVLSYDQFGNVLAYEHSVYDCIIHRMDQYELVLCYSKAIKCGGEYIQYIPLNKISMRHSSDAYQSTLLNTSDEIGETVIFTKIGYSKSRGRDVIMMFNTTISPVISTVKTIQSELIIISIIMTVAAIVISFLLARRVAEPIVRMNAGAKELADGNYDVRFAASGYREIAELSDTLTYAAEELSKTESLQRELIANISHDLRTPLTMIEGYAEVMRDIPGENTPENVQIIIDETKRLTSLVSDLLDISKLQSGTQKLELSDFNLTETIREVIGRFSKLTEQDGWVIDFNANEEVTVNADRTRILQVIYNFINNAITHSGSDRSVIVTQRIVNYPDKRVVRIEVTDHGEGIPEEKLPYIWDRYYKVDKTHKRAQMGSGLGLSIVKGILNMHGAKYGVESRVGEGSTFWFEL